MIAPPSWATLVRAGNPGPMTLSGTNTWVIDRVIDRVGGRIVVDPGPLLEEHLTAVAALGTVSLVLLTHRHPDHAEGAARFAEMTGAPVLDRADFPAGADVVPGIRAMHTPGHTGDSVSFVVSTEGLDEGLGEGADGGTSAVLTGDTILGRGSSVVAHPDGNLADYLSSLHRLGELGDITVLPGHGPVLGSARLAAAAYLEHRLRRLDQVRAALAAGDRTPAEIVGRVYADVEPALWPAAELSVRAQLTYLESEIH